MSSEAKIQGLHPSDAIVALVAYISSPKVETAEQAVIALTGFYSGEVRRYQAMLIAAGDYGSAMRESLNEEIGRLRFELRTAQEVNEKQASELLEIREHLRNSNPKPLGQWLEGQSVR